MTTQVHRAMMVEEAYAEMAQKLVAVFAPVSGPGMFVTPVYDVNGVIRYRASNGPIDPELAPLVDDPTGNALWTEIQARGLSAPEAAVRAMMSSAIVRSDCAVLDLIAADPELHGHDDPNAEAA